MKLNMTEIKDRARGIMSRARYPLEFFKFRACGKRIWLGPHGRFCRPQEISFGSNVFIGEGFHISARDLKFGSNIMIGPRLLIECDDHVFDEVGIAMFENRSKREVGSVTVEDDVWMGANVTLLKGVTVGEGSVIGANSVATKAIPPYAIAVGAPCRAIRPRFSFEQLQEHLCRVGSKYTTDTIRMKWEQAGL
jgi:acetyltransferase-like isoleucine patch superfamily enzyme